MDTHATWPERLAYKLAQDAPPSPPDLRSLARKSILLNYGIVLSALGVAVYSRRPGNGLNLVVCVLVMTIVLWALTVVASLLLVIHYRFRTVRLRLARREPKLKTTLSDNWIDGPSF